MAVTEENWDVVNLLIKKGARESKDYSAMKEIIFNDQSDSLTLLLQHNVLTVSATLGGNLINILKFWLFFLKYIFTLLFFV